MEYFPSSKLFDSQPLSTNLSPDSHNSGLYEASQHFSDIQAARGLYAGIVLLNEVEPFAVDKLPSLDVEDTFPHLQWGEPFENTSPQKGNHAAAKTLLKVLKENANEAFQMTFLEAPDMEAFLAQLQPTDTGNFRCQYCNRYEHNEFEATRCEVWDHFDRHHRNYKVGSDYWAANEARILLEIVSLTQSMTSIDAITASLPGRSAGSRPTQSGTKPATSSFKCSFEKLPSVNRFLQDLRASPSGLITCLQSKCANTSGFEPNLPNLKSHFMQHHCGHLLRRAPDRRQEIISDIDEAFEIAENRRTILGLVDEASRNSTDWSKSSPRRRKRIQSTMRFVRSNHRLLFEYMKKKRQWMVLQELRKVFSRRHDELLTIAAASERTQLSDILGTCKDAREMLESAALTFNDILRGREPDTLREIYCFVTLAYSITEVMISRGYSVSFDPTCLDFDSWKNCLSDGADKIAFGELFEKLWSLEMMKFSEILTINPRSSQTSTSIQGESFESARGYFEINSNEDSADNTPSSMFDIVTGLVNDTRQSYDFDFSLFLNQDAIRSINSSDCISNNVPSPRFLDMKDVQSSQANDIGNTILDENIGSWTGNRESPVRWTGGNSAIRETIIFMIVMKFWTFLSQLGPLLCPLFSLQSISSNMSLQNSSMMSMNFLRFNEQVKFHILNPVKLSSQFEDVWPIFELATKLVDLGWLVNLRELENYLLSTLRQLAPFYTFLDSLTKLITNGCRQAAQKLNCSPTYGRGCENSCEHSMEYVWGIPADPPSQSSPRSLYNSMTVDDSANVDLPSQVEAVDESEKSTHVQATLLDIYQNLSDSVSPQDPEESKDVLDASSEISSTCDECGKIYKGLDCRGNLRRHKKESHQLKSWECPFKDCGMGSARLHNVRNHWQRKHSQAEMPVWLKANKHVGGGGIQKRTRNTATR